MTILVTGGSGMVGRNIIALADERGLDIVAPSSTDMNLMEYGEVSAAIRSFEPDVVIHCAGLVGGIQANIRRPYEFCRENLLMGINLVQACLSEGVDNVINLGSSCMYPREAENPLKEESILRGELEPTNEGYALAKISVARLCAYASEEYKKNYKTLVPCNMYGYWDDFSLDKSHMVPAVLRRLHEAALNNIDSVDIWGDGLSRREFMFAEDLADFILAGLTRISELPDVLNIGLGKDYSIREYYEKIAEIVGYKGGFNYDLSKPSGMRQKLVDASAQSELGWSPKHTLEQGLSKTYDYFLREVA